MGEGVKRRWDKFPHDNKAIQLCFLPNAGGPGGGGQLRGKQALWEVAREARGPEYCSFKGRAIQVEPQFQFSPQANLQTIKRWGDLANASGTISAYRADGRAVGSTLTLRVLHCTRKAFLVLFPCMFSMPPSCRFIHWPRKPQGGPAEALKWDRCGFKSQLCH